MNSKSSMYFMYFIINLFIYIVLVFRNEKMEAIEAEKYKAYQQKSLEIISNKIENELTAEKISTIKKSKHYNLSIKKENLDKLSIDELSNILENSTDPIEIQVNYLVLNILYKH